MFDINNLNDKYFSEVTADEVLEIKSLSTEDKIKCFNYFLNSDVITNYSVISNLFMLIDGSSGIDEAAVNNVRVFYNDIEEYVDIKIELKQEIENFKKRLLECYLSIVEGLHVRLPELKTMPSNTCYNVLCLVNPVFISKIMFEQLKNVDISNVKPAFNAETLYDKINDKVYSQTYGIFENIMNRVLHENI